MRSLLLSRSRGIPAFLLVSLFAPCALAGGHRGPGDPLVGSWSATVTLRDCASGNPLPAPPFRAIVVFHAGGTVSEASGPSVRRTPSFGTWSRLSRRLYEASSVLLTYDAAGGATGSQEIRRTIRLEPDGQRFVAETTTLGIDPNGTVVFSGCARGEATRQL